VPISIAPEPDASFATWKRSVKVVPDDAEPVLVIVDENVTAVPATAAVGVTTPAVRFGPVTVTVAEAVAVRGGVTVPPRQL
jgi:hypothetical protein